MTHIKTITSFSNPFIKMLRGLDLKKNRDEMGVFIAEGLRHVREAIVCGWPVRTIVFQADDRQRAAIESLQHDLPQAEFVEVTRDILSKITHRENTETIVALIDQVWSELDIAEDGVWVVLDEVRDPGNLGTIMRTVDAVQARGIILVGACCDPFSSEAVRASMGSFARLKLVRAPHESFLRWCKSWPHRVVGTHLKGAVDYRTGNYTQPLLLMMGNEQKGLRDEMAEACTQLVKMPMRGGADSLNLAVATGIMLYEINRQL